MCIRTVSFVAHVKMAAMVAACLGFRQVQHVAVDFQNHVRGDVLNDGIWMGGGAIEKFHCSFDCFLGGLGLLGGKSAECSEHGAVNSSGAVQKGANNLEHEEGVCF